MKMKSILTLLLLLTAIVFVHGQEYKRNLRSQEEKQDKFNMYQLDRINKMHLVKALEMAGVRIFHFSLKPFNKKYQLTFYINEYVTGEKVDDGNEFSMDNTYSYYEKTKNNETIEYRDYIESITCYTKETDSTSLITIETYNMNLTLPVKKQITRESQSYYWRSYSQADWMLNETIPLLVYASSWYDEKTEFERFCGATDLSLNAEDTKDLLDSSPHYFVISYKIFE
ncbi:MAG: hypothetical protein EZS26_001534 [Candidatus Ordinivivax streblomastigis]|uniref:DUF5041 domain-containing protein n=1 Tax=Candidatus Ordinivivax streblomastigis TaxID=2540710 RepID=A0A5M8P1W5_9BACT|nr:MAG: hypothetical protein EZS26_001534 [Candidatus Ordinivivax streblomastigis]